MKLLTVNFFMFIKIVKLCAEKLLGILNTEIHQFISLGGL